MLARSAKPAVAVAKLGWRFIGSRQPLVVMTGRDLERDRVFDILHHSTKEHGLNLRSFR